MCHDIRLSYPDAPYKAYLRTKLSHFWGKCRKIYYAWSIRDMRTMVLEYLPAFSQHKSTSFVVIVGKYTRTMEHVG